MRSPKAPYYIVAQLKSNSIIGWHLAFAYPLQKAATLPFLFESIPGCTPRAGGEALKAIDRAPEKGYFLSIFAAKEMARTGETLVSELIQTCHERAYFELSHHYHSVRAEFVNQPGFYTADTVSAAIDQVLPYLSVNPGALLDQRHQRDQTALLETIWELYDLEKDLLCSDREECYHQPGTCEQWYRDVKSETEMLISLTPENERAISV